MTDFEEELDTMEVRELQKESSRALAHYQYGNNELYIFNQQAHHNSSDFYKAVLKKYFEDYHGLPSEIGPAKDIELVWDD